MSTVKTKKLTGAIDCMEGLAKKVKELEERTTALEAERKQKRYLLRKHARRWYH
jgi:hypothetical protein